MWMTRPMIPQILIFWMLVEPKTAASNEMSPTTIVVSRQGFVRHCAHYVLKIRGIRRQL